MLHFSSLTIPRISLLMNMTAATGDISNTESDRTITEISPRDVLLGMGAGANEHKGNIAFRATVVVRFKSAYMATTNRKTKNQVACKVIKIAEDNNGRFLQKRNSAEELYELADDAVVLEMTKQALRHIERVKRRKPSSIYQRSHQSASNILNLVRLKPDEELHAVDRQQLGTRVTVAKSLGRALPGIPE